jgi:hypothetical protein
MISLNNLKDENFLVCDMLKENNTRLESILITLRGPSQKESELDTKTPRSKEDGLLNDAERSVQILKHELYVLAEKIGEIDSLLFRDFLERKTNCN